MLYHYTSLSTAMKIVENGQLHATHISYLNDTEEYAHCVRLVSRNSPEEYRQGIVGQLLRDVVRAPMFVACLSRKEDDLNQWRAYGGDYVGAAIGFDEGELRKLGQSEPRFDVAHCLYDPDEQQQLIQPLVDSMHQFVKNLEPILPTAKDGGMSWTQRGKRMYMHVEHHVGWELTKLAPQIKAKAFKEEEEVRIVVSGPVQMQGHQTDYRLGMGGASIVPFLRVSVAGAMRELWIGPGPHPKHCEHGATTMVNIKRPGLSVRPSHVPFRNW